MLTAHFDGASFFAPDAEDPDHIRALGKARHLRCPFCEAPVYFRGRVGGEKIWHFAHFSGATCTVDDPDYRPESHEHQQMKWAIYGWLIDRFGASAATVEKRVETGQIADVLFHRNGQRIAFEVQRSPLSPKDWLGRRKGYRSIGIHDIWILVGDRHLSVDPVRESSTDASHAPIVNPGPLARSLFEVDGRVLWVSDNHVDHLRSARPAVQIPSAADLLITELAGHPPLYSAVSVAPDKIRRRFDGAPFPERPEDLIGAVVGNVPFPMWAELVSQPTIPVAPITPMKLEAFQIHLSRLPANASRPAQEERLEEETPLQDTNSVANDLGHGPWTLESPATSLTSYDHARKWEEARIAWTKDWTRRKEKWAAQAWRKRQQKKRDALTAIGKVVDKHLRSLLSSLTNLQTAAADMSEHEIRNHPGIDSGMQKWDVKNWTPLANLNAGVDWIFGVPPRLWQAVTYATQFYHSYAKRYRKDADIDASGYGFCTSGFAIKALGHRGILSSKCLATARFREASAEIRDLIESIEYDVDRPPTSGRKRPAPPPGEITLHGLRHVVVVSYMELLVRHRFLKRNQLNPPLSTLPGHSLRERLRSACSYVRARDQSSRPPAASTFIHLAEQWLFWACRIDAVRKASYALVSPFHPPYFKNATHRSVRDAVRAGHLLPTENGMQTVDGSTLTTFDWKTSTYDTDWLDGQGQTWHSKK